MAMYHRLDPSRSEVRMLTIVDNSDLNDTDHLVHCVLKTESLDDLTPEFAEFLSESNQVDNISNPTLLKSWVDNSERYITSGNPIRVPIWRKHMSDCDEVASLRHWDDMMKDSGFDSSLMPEMPSLSLPLLAGSPPSHGVRLRRTAFALMPRFLWGDFEAVSYCWESDVREKSIVLNGIKFPVPKNLEALLRRLRTLPETKSGMNYWIDALCINQDNLEEKNEQVKLMQRIYKSAFAVVVWLGPSADESDAAAYFIASIARRSIDYERAILGRANDYEDGPPVGHYRLTPLDNPSDMKLMSWKILLSFFCRDYWRRLWIIQELALNHNMTLFLCGERQISRSMIRRTCDWCKDNSRFIDTFMAAKLDDVLTSVAPLNRSIYPTFYHVNTLVTIPGQLAEGTEIDTVLDLCRKAGVVRPLDKIYGLLGLLPSSLTVAITPDYNASQMHVYSQFARRLLEQTNRADSVLSWCTYEEGSAMPSWVPNWMSRFHCNHLQWLRKHCASENTTSQWSISADYLYLTCRGIIADIIKDTSGSPSENLPYKTELPEVDLSTTEKRSHCYETKQGIAAALQRIILQDRNGDRASKRNPLNINWINWNSISSGDVAASLGSISESARWEAFDQFRQTNAHFSLFGHHLKDFFPAMEAPVTASPREEESLMHFATLTLIGRRLMTTESGYLGLVTEAVEEGDVVAVLYGCNFPVVLRRNGDRYWYLGACYIDGMMKGEVVRRKMQGDLEEVDLTLC